MGFATALFYLQKLLWPWSHLSALIFWNILAHDLCSSRSTTLLSKGPLQLLSLFSLRLCYVWNFPRRIFLRHHLTHFLQTIPYSISLQMKFGAQPFSPGLNVWLEQTHILSLFSPATISIRSFYCFPCLKLRGHLFSCIW